MPNEHERHSTVVVRSSNFRFQVWASRHFNQHYLSLNQLYKIMGTSNITTANDPGMDWHTVQRGAKILTVN